jgi:putative ABC transport system permease protein
VKQVTPLVQLPAIYQKSDQTVPIAAVDPQAMFAIFPEYHTPQAALEAMRTHRSGAIVGALAARRYGIRAGDHIVLKSQTPRRDGSNAWPLDVLGIFDVPSNPAGAATAIVSFDYVNEARLADRDTALLYIVLADGAAHAAAVRGAIDRTFANSSSETRTQSEGDLIATVLQRLADIDFIVSAIMSAVFFALLFATGSLLMQSVRERVPELAVLKTVGFSDARVMALILLETVVVCVFAAGLGLALAAVILPAARDLIGITAIPLSVLLWGITFAVALALCGGSPPALRGLKLPVAAALAGR